MAGDKALMLPVVKHVINNVGSDYKWVWILQPTSPFRMKQDFLNIKDMLEKDPRGVMSLKPAKESPNRMYSFKERKFYRTKYANFNNKEDLKPMFERSGNFYVSKKRIFRDSDSMEDIFDKGIEGYMMGGVTVEDMRFDGKIKEPHLWEKARAYGSNIDGPEDLALARYYVQKGVVKL
jgi:CMP-N-acetylneuraminic acid synthetase